MAQLVAGREAGRALADQHLLLLAREEPADAVVGLVRLRHPEVAAAGEGSWRLGRWTALSGPLLLDAAAAAAAGVPDPWRAAWSVRCPVERDEPPPPGATDREGLHRAFPGGLPVRAERRALDLLLALGRRLGGAVRVAGSGVLLRPDPLAWVERTAYSPYWLPPQEALAAVRPAVPRARLATEGSAWEGLGPAALAALEDADPRLPGGAREREVLHLAAEARDAAAAAAPDVLDAYALAVDLGPGGVVQLEVGGVREVPGVLAGLPWAASAVAYTAAWWSAEPASVEHEVPAPDVRAARAEALAVVEALVGALAPAVSAVVVDADGFPLV